MRHIVKLRLNVNAPSSSIALLKLRCFGTRLVRIEICWHITRDRKIATLLSSHNSTEVANFNAFL